MLGGILIMLSPKQQELIDQFNRLNEEHDGKVVLNARLGKCYFWKIDDGNKLTRISKVPIHARIVSSLEKKGNVIPVDSNMNELSNEEFQSSKYDNTIKYVGAILKER